jgi:hypothetical protein
LETPSLLVCTMACVANQSSILGRVTCHSLDAIEFSVTSPGFKRLVPERTLSPLFSKFSPFQLTPQGGRPSLVVLKFLVDFPVIRKSKLLVAPT